MKAVIERVDYIKEYENKYGTFHLHKVYYDGKTALYNSKSKEQSKFIMGQEAEFTIEMKTGKNGEFLTIKPMKQGGGGGYSNYGKALKKEQSRYAGFAMSYSKDLVVADKIKIDDMSLYTKKMFDLMVELDKTLEA